MTEVVITASKYFKRLFTQAMDDNSSRYFCWKVPDLKAELIKRGAVTTGRKQDLIERLIFSLNMSFSSKLSQVAHSILRYRLPDFYNRRLVSIHLDLGLNRCYEVIQLYFAYQMDEGDLKYQLSVA